MNEHQETGLSGYLRVEAVPIHTGSRADPIESGRGNGLVNRTHTTHATRVRSQR
nr:hypothetical protein [Aminobacter aminovorans]